MTSVSVKKDLGRVASALEENLSDAELDRLLADQHEQIEALLEEAREAKARGDAAPLEPLHVFLSRARERFAVR
jgi:hypothetical protein